VNGIVSRVRGSRRTSAIVVGVLILLVAAAAWLGVVSPKRSHVSQLKSDVAAAQAQLASATQVAAVANRKAAAAATLAAPNEPDQPGILDQLNQLGHKTGVEIATVAPTTSSTALNVVPLSITVDGTYFQIRNFLNKLRQQVQVGKNGRIVATGRLYDVQSLNISMGSTSGQLAATVTVNASTFSPTTPTAATSASAAAAPAGSTG
jgi:Tfp pilus assembly protein PilO